MNEKQKYLIVTTYADEIPLHAGGLIANAVRDGHHVHVLVLCHPGYPPRAMYPEVSPENPYGPFKTREAWEEEFAKPELEKVLKILGVHECTTWPFVGNLHQLFEMELVDRLHVLLNEMRPDAVVTHWPISDYTDFIGAGTAVMRVMIERRLEKMPMVYFSETLTGRHSLCFKPDVYIDISDTIAIKKEACGALWKGKNLDYFFNPYALPVAQFRGRECGVPFAEAYVALHGLFGIEKRALVGPLPDCRPRTLSTALETLPAGQVWQGARPHSYGSISSEDAFKIYGV